MNLTVLAERVNRSLSRNSPAILTAIGVTGVLTTAYLTGKASIKAYQIVYEAESVEGTNGEFWGRAQERFKLTWTCYIPPVLTGLLTCTAIVMSNRISDKRATALAAAYTLSEKAFTEYKDKVVETLGKTKERNMSDRLAQDRVNQNPPPENSSVLIVSESDVLCYEAYTGRYFVSNIEKIKRAQNNVNYKVLNNFYASLSDFYDELDLPHTTVSDEVGWNSDDLLEVSITAVMTEEQKPAISIDYRVAPILGYYRVS